MILLYDLIKYILWTLASCIIYTSQGLKVTSRKPLTDSILHYEPLDYSRYSFLSQHQRIRRSIDGHNDELHLNFRAYKRNFNLRLKRDKNLFTHNLHIENESEDFHPANIYEGYLLNEPSSFVHGFIHNNVFEGRVHTQDGKEYHIESAKQYGNHVQNETIHSVMYDVNDIHHEGNQHRCGGISPQHHRYNNMTSKIHWTPIDESAFKSSPPVHHHNRMKREVDVEGKKTECHLYVRADPTYRKWAKDDNRAMYLMTQHVKKVSYIFKSSDFDENGIPDDYTLHIKRIGVIDTSHCEENIGSGSCRFKPENIGVEKFLDIASLDDHSQYCLSYVFAYRDFQDGVLGLAWIGDIDGAGGICDGYQSISGVMKSLNTGIVSNLNYGKAVPSRVTDVTLAHEIGHNYGSKHDPTSGRCAPGGSGGNYIMYPRATSGSETNNNKFSDCSKESIYSVLKVKSHRCFKVKGEPSCGNRVVEEGEQCDCGYLNEQSCKKDLCCHGASQNGGGSSDCKFTPKAMSSGPKRCSPSQGFCCNVQTCLPHSNASKVNCSSPVECAEGSVCNDQHHTCPKPVFKQNNTRCNTGSNVCINGECSGSLCSIIGKVDCQCSEESYKCSVCCQDKKSNDNQGNCTLFKDRNIEIVKRPPGSPCNQYQGYCDILYKCRNVDAEGPLSRLKKWLSNPQSFSTILDWMKTRWWACVLIGLGLLLFMGGFIACCSVHTPSSNPTKPPARTLTQTLSRRGRNRPPRPTAPTQCGSSGSEFPQDLPPGYNTAVREHRRVENNSFEMR